MAIVSSPHNAAYRRLVFSVRKDGTMIATLTRWSKFGLGRASEVALPQACQRQPQLPYGHGVLGKRLHARLREGFADAGLASARMAEIGATLASAHGPAAGRSGRIVVLALN